jgi:hypothetical protein
MSSPNTPLKMEVNFEDEVAGIDSAAVSGDLYLSIEAGEDLEAIATAEMEEMGVLEQ